MCLNVERIRELREKRKLTQQQAAELAGMGSKQAWSNFENGRDNPTLDRLAKVAEVLGVKPRELIK